jgi:multisubunit Na+/H+ antiporter MnhC subunit
MSDDISLVQDGLKALSYVLAQMEARAAQTGRLSFSDPLWAVAHRAQHRVERRIVRAQAEQARADPMADVQILAGIVVAAALACLTVLALSFPAEIAAALR